MAIKTGMATRTIPTQPGMWLTGYIARLYPSTGTHDQLKVRCVAFDDGTSRLVFAICDLLGLEDSFVKEVQARVESRTGLPAADVVVGCIHTHSAPCSVPMAGVGALDSRWLADLQGIIVDCACAALNSLEPSFLSFRTGTCSIAFNRVIGSNDGDPGPIDAQVSALEISRTERGAPHAMIVNYACHPVSLTADNLLCGRDYPHYLEQALREAISADLDVIFMTGCCGDIDPARRGGFGEAEHNGRELGRGILAARAPSLTPADFRDAKISVQATRIRVPLERRYSDAELSGFIQDYETFRAARGPAAEPAVPDVDERIKKAHADYARAMLAGSAAGRLPTEIHATVRTIRIGRLVIATHPFEAFHEIGVDIKARFGPATTMVMGYADGDFGYVASPDMYDRSQYEVGDAFVYYGYPGPMARGAGGLLVDALTRTP